MVGGSNKLHNARAIVSDLQGIGQSVLDRFTVSKKETLWYYDKLATIHIQCATPVAKALRRTVVRMHKLGGEV